jgi:ribosomal protein L7/L12
MPDLRALSRTQLSATVQGLVASGRKIEAIKVYRDETGVDLATAKRIIESL